MARILVNNAIVVGADFAPTRGWLLTDDARIAALGQGDAPQEIKDQADECVDARGAYLMPGAIDAHVHFREPGLTHKATIASESRAAVAGGVTSFIDMPNTKPATTTNALIEAKMDIAAHSSVANYGFMIGATSDNLQELQNADYSQVFAVKLFMGSSTGNMLVDDDSALRRIFAEQPARVVVHAEDQHIIDANIAAAGVISDPENMIWHTRLRNADACVRATERAMQMAVRYGTRLHVAHVTTREEVAMFSSGQVAGKQITAEVSPHHLLFTTDDYARLGSRIKMNPAVKSAADRTALRQALSEGRIDIVATDHAPHLLSEKAGNVFTAVSGAPMVQFSLPVMMDLYDPATVAERMCTAPAELYGIEGRGRLRPGYYADLVLVERLPEPYVVTDADVLSLCGWTPLAGHALHHRVVRTWVNGGKGAMALRRTD